MRTNYKHKYTVADVEEIVKNSLSVRQVLEKLKIAPAGGNYATINKFFKTHNIDISHFSGKTWNRGRVFSPKKPISFYLTPGSTISSYKLKNRLLKEGVMESKCYKCGLIEWLGEPIPLELEHIDGVRDNNELNNLTSLCPNCHAQTETYRGKNIGKNKMVRRMGFEPTL